jgi:hypothetical protein
MTTTIHEVGSQTDDSCDQRLLSVCSSPIKHHHHQNDNINEGSMSPPNLELIDSALDDLNRDIIQRQQRQQRQQHQHQQQQQHNYSKVNTKKMNKKSNVTIQLLNSKLNFRIIFIFIFLSKDVITNR